MRLFPDTSSNFMAISSSSCTECSRARTDFAVRNQLDADMLCFPSIYCLLPTPSASRILTYVPPLNFYLDLDTE